MDPLEGPTMWKGGRDWNLEPRGSAICHSSKKGIVTDAWKNKELGA